MRFFRLALILCGALVAQSCKSVDHSRAASKVNEVSSEPSSPSSVPASPSAGAVDWALFAPSYN